MESIEVQVSEGVLRSLIPQYMVRGKAVIPAHVIKVPSGTESFLSRAIVRTDEPVTKSTRVITVTDKEL